MTPERFRHWTSFLLDLPPWYLLCIWCSVYFLCTVQYLNEDLSILYPTFGLEHQSTNAKPRMSGYIGKLFIPKIRLNLPWSIDVQYCTLVLGSTTGSGSRFTLGDEGEVPRSPLNPPRPLSLIRTTNYLRRIKPVVDSPLPTYLHLLTFHTYLVVINCSSLRS